jgi:hypothetical protein
MFPFILSYWTGRAFYPTLGGLSSRKGEEDLTASCTGGLGSLNKFEKLRRRLSLLALGLVVLLLLWVVLSPAESRLGNLVKLVYVHGALVWTGLLAFSVAGLLGLVALVVRRPPWYRATRAAGLGALVVWGVYVLSAMAVTGLTWGQLVAWNEPRVRATGLILVAAVVLFMVARLVDQADFTAIVSLVMGVVPWVLVGQADAIRHPVDPIGGSGSSAIQGFYWLIVVTIALLAGTLIVWLWAGMEAKAETG